MSFKKEILKEEEEKSLKPFSEYDVTSNYIEWAQHSARNTLEYSYLLSLANTEERDVVVKNVCLFYDIQYVLKTKQPYIHEITFKQLLDYIYENQIYREIYYEGYYFHESSRDRLLNEQEIKSFVRVHFDPQQRRLTGSSMDKVVSWIREGASLDNLIQSLNHYYDHRKMYNDGNVYLEHLRLDDFLNLNTRGNFNLYRSSHYIFSKLNEKLRKEITGNEELYAHFMNLVKLFNNKTKNKPNFSTQPEFEAFNVALSKADGYADQPIDMIYNLINALTGFDFDKETQRVINDARHNSSLKIIKSELDFFIFMVKDFQTLKRYSSSSWCINRNIDTYSNYIHKHDDFYIILERNPKSLNNHKTGVTFSRLEKKIKYSFNNADKSNVEHIEKYKVFFKTKWFDWMLSKKANHDNAAIDVPYEEAAESNEANLILPHY